MCIHCLEDFHMGTKDKHCSLMMSQARSSLIPNTMVFSLSSLEDLNKNKVQLLDFPSCLCPTLQGLPLANIVNDHF